MKKFVGVILTMSIAVTMFAGCNDNKDYEEVEDTVPAVTIEDAETGDEEEPIAEIANPWVDYDNVEEAKAAAGVTFTMPDELVNGGYDIVYRANATVGMLEIIFNKDGNEAFRLRAVSEEEISDISGDYNTYEYVDVSTIDGFDVNVSSNDINSVSIVNFYCDGTTFALTANEMDKMEALEVVEYVIYSNAIVY